MKANDRTPRTTAGAVAPARAAIAATAAAVAAITAAACAGPGSPFPTGPLAYDVPSPPSATYQVVDSIVTGTTMTGMTMDFGVQSTMTLALEFAADPGGVRVTGTVEDLDVAVSNEMVGTERVDESILSGEYVVLLSRTGEQEVVSAPEFSEMPDLGGFGTGLMSLSEAGGLGQELFPPLPDEVVGPGDTWVDTVSQDVDAEGTESTTTTTITYTLAGDTVIDGRAMLHITVASETAAEVTIEMMGMSMTTTTEFSTTGFVLWDIDRGLVAYAESQRSGSGSVQLPPPMPSGQVTISGSSRVRLER